MDAMTGLAVADREGGRGGVTAARLAGLFTPQQLDAAIDRAGRRSEGVIAWFLGAPMNRPGNAGGHASAGIEFVVEFFVPPQLIERFAAELETALLRASGEYALGRRVGLLAAPVIRVVQSGTFHQWRIAFRETDEAIRTARWSADRELLESVLHQSQVGWSEFLG